MWKRMKGEYISILPPSQGTGYLMPSSFTNIAGEEKAIEHILKDKIASIRMNDEHMTTSWDNHLSYLLSTALINYEHERVGSATFA